MLGARVFSYKPAPLSGVFPLAMGSLLSVAFMNLNLSHNSVGFYQLSKLACIPCTLLVQYLAYSQTISRRVMLTLVPITFGVGFATVYDLDINFLGFVFAVAAVVATSFAQIFTNTYQVSHPLAPRHGRISQYCMLEITRLQCSPAPPPHLPHHRSGHACDVSLL